ncbi:MAG: hypothetical protein Q9167_007949 [Letrouitia subvulpina]
MKHLQGKVLHDSSLDHAFNDLKVMESNYQLVIALDFGTTFSGIAYGFTQSSQSDPTSVQDWPGTEGWQFPKTPTIFCYNRQDSSFFSWGSQVEPTNPEKIEAIKLLLDPDQPTPSFVPDFNTKRVLSKLGKSPVDAASDYIGAIYKHGLEKINAAVPKEYFEMQQKKLILTVPAIWSDKAKDLTLRAAKNAGIYPVTLVKEPEAAAIYTFDFLKDKALAVGDAFVLCDAGGGTVDLISYEVTEVSPLKLKELVPGTGGLAGSLMLNRRFEASVKNIVGEKEFSKLQKTRAFSQAMKFFDQEVKPSFRTDKNQSWYISFPMARLKDNPANNLQADTLTLTNDAVYQIFDPVISTIEGLVTEQVNRVKLKRIMDSHPKGKDIKAIFLVGGFGSNHFLKLRLEMANPGVQIIQPPDAWAAIAKGAVLSQIRREAPATITSTVARRHYGVSANGKYNEDEDIGQPKIWDHYDGIWRVSKMIWYIQMGEDLRWDQKIASTFFRNLKADFTNEDLIFDDELLECEAIDPLKYPKDGRRCFVSPTGDWTKIKYFAGVTKVNCVPSANLTNIPPHLFIKGVAADGTEYVKIKFDLVIETKNANMEFFMEVNGKRVGQVSPEYK